MDPQTASTFQISENLLQTIAEMDEATAEESETGLLKQGEDGLTPSGLTSWIGVMKDTGAFVSVLSSDTELGEDDQYVCADSGTV